MATTRTDYQLIRAFAGVGMGNFKRDISALWPVLNKCREFALAHPEQFVQPWLAIALELYKVPVDPEEFAHLYEAVVGFIQLTEKLKGAAPLSADL